MKEYIKYILVFFLYYIAMTETYASLSAILSN